MQMEEQSVSLSDIIGVVTGADCGDQRPLQGAFALDGQSPRLSHVQGQPVGQPSMTEYVSYV